MAKIAKSNQGSRTISINASRESSCNRPVSNQVFKGVINNE